ncbi:glycoside hydrolase family protein [Achromobacter sp. NFACC18-2]|uniref:glycoside hydrolase family protein n=1 Tax=Achromobacter sp. NFACC18-2 TaxID=1564112 RepID=UPI00352F24E0
MVDTIGDNADAEDGFTGRLPSSRSGFIRTLSATRGERTDLAEAHTGVRRLINVPLRDRQCAALIDFTYTLGADNLASSDLRRKFTHATMFAGASS